MPLLQLALDLLKLDEAIRIAGEVADHFDLVEAGTPLIKSIGMKAVSELKRAFPDKQIVADLKIADAGFLEVELAARAGADLVSALAIAPHETLIQVKEASSAYGVKIIGDLLGAEDIEEKVKQLEELGFDYALVHVGIDQQARKSPLEGLNKIKRRKIKLGIAGGMNPERMRSLKGKAVDLIVVGSFVTKAADPRLAAMELRKALEWLKS